MKKKRLPEIRMFYNVEDNRYYIYFGEDYVNDTKDINTAILIFEEQCELLKQIQNVNQRENL